MSGIFKYLPHVIIAILLGLFIFGILRGCENLKNPDDKKISITDPGNISDDENESDPNLDDLFEEDTEDETIGNTREEGMEDDTEESVTDNSATTGESSTSKNDGISSEGGNFLVLAGTFTSEVNAKNEMSRLQKLGFQDAEVLTFDFSEYYSLAVGRYETLSEARSLKRKLSDQFNIEAYVHKRRGVKVN